VSKIVSVKFHRASEAVAETKPQTIETPLAVKPVEDEEDKLQTRSDTIEVAETPSQP
jgi:hypothetical protein